MSRFCFSPFKHTRCCSHKCPIGSLFKYDRTQHRVGGNRFWVAGLKVTKKIKMVQMLISSACWNKCCLALERLYCLVFLDTTTRVAILTGQWTLTCLFNALSVKLAAIPKSMPCLFPFNQNEAIIYELNIMLLWLSYKIRIKFHLKTRGQPFPAVTEYGFTFNTTCFYSPKSILYNKILEIEAF